jgi:hypothetical protein
MLPGMSGQATETSGKDDSDVAPDEEKLDRIIQQNDRIIELLREISSSYSSSSKNDDAVW